MRIVTTLVLAVVMAGLTLLYGWWTVPIVAFVWGLAAGRWSPRAAALAALAAALAWGALLGVDALGGRLGGLGTLFGTIAKQPRAVFFALSLLFPAVLAWSAAALGADLRGRPARRKHYVAAADVLGRDETGRPGQVRAPG